MSQTELGNEELIKKLADRDDAVAMAACEILKEKAEPENIQSLLNVALRQGRGAAKAVEILAAMTPEGPNALYELWFSNQADMMTQAMILEGLSLVEEPRTERLAFLALMSPDEELEKAGIKAATRLNSKKLWGNVAKLLKSENLGVRAKACESLKELGEKEALKYLEEMGIDEDGWVEEERQLAISELSRHDL